MPPKRSGAHDVPGEVTAKLVVVGQAFVGKSCLAARISKNEFSPTQEPTIGAAFVSYRTTISSNPEAPRKSPSSGATNASAAGTGSPDDDTTVKFEIWDTAGQERFRSLTPMYFRGAVAGLVVFDVSSGDTLRKARSWITELRKTRDSLAIVLVGNKADLPEEKREVTKEEGEALAEEENVGYFETSAKTGMNVREVFDHVAREVVGRNLAQPAKAPVGVGSLAQASNRTSGGGGSGGNNSARGNGGDKCKC